MKNKKKLLCSLGAIGVIAMPAADILSCGDKKPSSDPTKDDQ